MLLQKLCISDRTHVIGLNAAISACENGRQWTQELALLHILRWRGRKSGMIANMISFSADISSREEGKPLEQTLALPHKMREIGRTADVSSYTAISACKRGCQGQWEQHWRCSTRCAVAA